MKPPTPRLTAVEAAEQALELRVWAWDAGVLGGGELAGVEDEGGRRGRLEGWLGATAAGGGGGLRGRGGRAAWERRRPRVAVAGADGGGDGGRRGSGGRWRRAGRRRRRFEEGR
jgi:hypothetical protein